MFVSVVLFSAQASAQHGGATSPAQRARERLQAQKDKAAKAKEEKEEADKGTKAKKNEPSDELPGTGAQPPDTMDAIAEAVDTPYRPKPGGHLIKFNLEDADLAELVNHIAGLTGRRFIYGAKVRDIKVTVVSPTPVTLNEAYEVFLSILSANGMTVVPHGRFMKIVDSGGIVTKGPPVYSRGAPVPDTDRMVTRLYRLRFASAGEVSKILLKFKSKEGDITTYEEGQLLILTDRGTNIRRMIRLIEEIDLGGVSAKMWIEPVNYGSADDLAKKLNDIYDLGKGGGAGLERVVAEEQTNSLIIIGTEESYFRVLELLKRIDIAPAAEGDIHVLTLQHADAEDLSKTLTTMLRGNTTKKGKAGTQQVAEVFEGEIRITADKSTNSLVISSSGHDFAQLRSVVEKLDQERRQVFLEAVIMDVSVDRSSQLGLAYHGGVQDLVGDESVIVGGFEPIKSIAPDATQLQALALGVRGQDLPGTQNIPGLPAGVSIPAFGVFLNALAESGDSNVLSTPHIIATDNTEAEISVGENVPLQTNLGGGGLGSLASLAQQAGGGNTQNLAGLGALGGFASGFNAQRTDVGTKIKITPHINDENQVRLEIQEEISETGAPVGALGVVSITKRVATTTVVVDDQQTVVIGGLMRDTKEQGRKKVPILGDLPVLGFLFRSSTERTRKTNLLLILTPHVIRDQRDLRKVFQRKMQERQQFLDRFFVFSSDWSPPKDFSRTNGLVEQVRQSMFELDEAERLAEETKPREEKFHEPTPPLDLAADLKGSGPKRKSTPKKNKSTPKKKATPKRPKKSEAVPLRVEPVARSISADDEAPQLDRVE
jgi:general secretion pathway protein D